MINLTSFPQTTDAIVNGEVDAVVSIPPYTDDAMNKAGTNLVSWPAQSGQPIFQLLASRNEWIAKNPALVERFLKVMDQTEDFIQQNPVKAKEIVKNKFKLTDNGVSEAWTQNQFSLSLDLSLLAAMNDEARWMINNNLTTEKTVPDFYNYIYSAGLKTVRPGAVNISK